MSWQVLWHPKAAKYVESLQSHSAERVMEKLEEVCVDPFRYLEHFEGNGYKLRIGEYRALVDVDFQKQLLKIQVFDKRGRVYN